MASMYDSMTAATTAAAANNIGTFSETFQVAEYDEDPNLASRNDSSVVDRREYVLHVSSTLDHHTMRKDDVIRSSSKTSTNDTTKQQQQAILRSFQNFARQLRQILSDLFLPIGYPHSVEKTYFSYQIYDSLQGLCSYLRGVVSTSAVLTASGVGNADATAMSAAMTWAMRDGVGMLGGLLFSYYASPHYDAHVKEFRLFADLINDAALTLDMITPYVPSYCLLWVMSASTLSKTMCGMSAGATKSSITFHLAKEGNMGDLNAKEGTQETLVSLIGMVLGVQLAHQLNKLEQQQQPAANNGGQQLHWTSFSKFIFSWLQEDENIMISSSFALSWIIFIILTLVHMWANWKGVKLLKLRDLNRERAIITLRNLIHSLTKESAGCATNLNVTMLHHKAASWEELLPAPDDICESLFQSTMHLIFPNRKINLGSTLLQTLSENAIGLLREFHQEKYIVGIKGRKVLVTLKVGATKDDEIKAFVHAMSLSKHIQHQSKLQRSSSSNNFAMIQITHAQIIDSGLFTKRDDRSCLLLELLSRKGWQVDGRMYLGFPRCRTQWESIKMD